MHVAHIPPTAYAAASFPLTLRYRMVVPRINRTGDVRAVNYQMWLLTIIAAIADYIGDPDTAASYEAAMRRRFLSLRVINELESEVVPNAGLS